MAPASGYVIEALLESRPPNGKISQRWYSVGNNTDSIKAQNSYSGYRRAYPTIPFRVVERETRRIVVLFDPRSEAA